MANLVLYNAQAKLLPLPHFLWNGIVAMLEWTLYKYCFLFTHKVAQSVVSKPVQGSKNMAQTLNKLDHKQYKLREHTVNNYTFVQLLKHTQ